MAENLLSKVKIGEVTYNLKDADSRTKLTTLIGTHALEALGNAAWYDVESTLANDSKLPTGAAVKTYVDAEIAKVPKFDVVICAAEASKIPAGAIYKDGTTTITGTMAASADTMYKIYFVKNTDAGAGAYVEYITVKNGETYSWEQIGTTVVDLSNYVQKTTQIAGVAINDGIAKADLQGALELKALAYKDTAAGTVAGQTISGVKASYTPAGTIAVNDLTQTATAASLTKGDFTPAGSITGSAISGGSINVTVKDAASATAVTDLTYENYTPAGTIAAKATGGTSSVLASASLEADASGVAVTGTVSKPNVTITAGTEKTFATGLTGGSVASIDTAKFSGGSFTGASQASFTQGAKASFTQGSKAALSTSDISYVEKGVEVSVDTTDTEMLVFTNVTAKSAKAVDTFTADGDDSFTANGDDSFTANNVGTFTAAAISDGFFTPNTLQDVSTDKVHDTPTAALAEAPTFTGDKFRVATTTDTVLKDVEFTGTAAAVKLTGAKYLKQEIDTKTFTPVAAELGFSGTKAENVLVTAVSYDKATANGATFTGTAGEASVGDIVVSAKDVTVE